MGVTYLITLVILVFSFQLPAHAQAPLVLIVGGTSTTAESFPWQLLVIVKKYSDKTSYLGGGSTISLSWCMSAAHNFAKPKEGASEGFTVTAESIVLYAGVTDRTRKTSDPNVQHNTFNEEEIKKHVFIHPKYGKGGKHNNDITIIKLKEPWMHTETVSPIALANLDDFDEGKKVTASGWGMLSTKGPFPKDLQKVSGLNLISRETCREHWDPKGYPITDTMICQKTEDKNTCTGDSGGPVITGSGESNGPPYVQIGIVSWGSINCDAYVPKVFVEVAKFKTWIAETKGGCPESQGFTKLPGTNRCFKIFLDVDRDWHQTMKKCRDEGLTMVKTSDADAVIIRNGLVDKYGIAGEYAWLNAKFNGVQYAWSDGELIADLDRLWYPGNPELKTDYCLVLLNSPYFVNQSPLTAYYSDSCTSTAFGRKAFCERDLSSPSV